MYYTFKFLRTFYWFSAVVKKSQLPLGASTIFYLSLFTLAQMAQTEELILQNVVYRPTVCKLGGQGYIYYGWEQCFLSIRSDMSSKKSPMEKKYNIFFSTYLLLTPAKKRACSLIFYKKKSTLLANCHVINWEFLPTPKSKVMDFLSYPFIPAYSLIRDLKSCFKYSPSKL